MHREELHFWIDGMHCVNCQTRIQRMLEETPGVLHARVSYDRGDATLTCDTDVFSDEQLRRGLEQLGYAVRTERRSAEWLRALGYLSLIAALYALLEMTGALNLLAPGQLAQANMSYGMLFMVGLMTSIHCVAMCGGIGLSQVLPARDTAQRRSIRIALKPALCYNAGRIVSYTLTGAILGFCGMLFGSGLNTSLSVLLQGVLKLLAGLVMVCMGLNLLGLFPELRRFRFRLPFHLPKRRGHGPLVAGLLNGLMPCGPLQAMQLVALASASPLRGGCAMLAFSLGTVPLMLGLSSLVAALGRKFGKAVTGAGAVLVVVLGLSMLSQGAVLAGIRPQMVASDAQAAAVQKDDAGVQIVRSTLQTGQYPNITVAAGRPVRWIIDAPDGSINGCNNRIYIPALNVEYSFQPGENIIEFTPFEAGDMPYSCWMGMIRGNISVLESGGEAVEAPLMTEAPISGASCCDPVQ